MMITKPPLVMTLLWSLLFTASVFAQCTEQTEKKGDADYNYTLFAEHGISLQDYDWKNPEINCHINLATSYHSRAGAYSVGGGICMGIGVSLLIGGIAKSSAEGGGGGLIAGGLLLSAAGIAGLVVSINSRNKMSVHLGQAADLFRAYKSGK